MSGKSRVSQRQRGPSGQGQSRPGARQPGQDTAPQKNAAGAGERRARSAAARQAQRRRKVTVAAAIAAGVAAVIAVLFVIFQNSSSPPSAAGAYPYQVGSPGAGQAAPGFSLAASTGGDMTLSQFRGKTVLLFFQEGLTCQPCWDQITDLQKHAAQLKAAGIDQVVSVTSDPVGAITTKTHDMGLTIPVLSDPNLAVSQQYHANGYGMMGASRDGHTFIEVGPDGTIRWRADYGGAPKYTMFLPTASLLADIKAGEHPSS
ncbi:MAG: peroxiredoxin family protein [Actinomycetota bacterium]|nr:peroxiredoxin family protein [Actinomycetota bacterium]